MRTLHLSQFGCYVSLRQEFLIVKRKEEVLTEVPLRLIDQILLFGKSQITTQAICACLQRNIPIAYLSRMGFCYGRVLSIEQGYRHLTRYQQEIGFAERFAVAQSIIRAKIRNSRVILQRQQRRRSSERLVSAIQGLDYLAQRIEKASDLDQLLGYEGSAASLYFNAFGDCIEHSDFVFLGRSRRPPGNPVNALLSFGYQVLWNHLLTLIELQGLDPYQACLHRGHERHAALASDLLEEFRAPIIDSLVLYVINRNMISGCDDFDYHDGGCFLNDSGRRKFLRLFIQRMEEELTFEQEDKQPRWNLLTRQVKRYKSFIYSPIQGYQPYMIR